MRCRWKTRDVLNFCFALAAATYIYLFLRSTIVREQPPIQFTNANDWALPEEEHTPDFCTARNDWIAELYATAQKNIPAPCDHITRIGGESDGGKLFCSDGFPNANCVVYSLGSRLDFTFESDVIKRLKCVVYTFDCTVGEPQAEKIPAGIHFFPWCVGGKDEVKSFTSDLLEQGRPHIGQYYTLDTILKKLGHARIDLLKMDIERHELDVIASLSRKEAPTQLLFETHLHNAYGAWGRPMSALEWQMLWDKLRRLRYGIFSFEPNPGCKCCSEWSLRQVPN